MNFLRYNLRNYQNDNDKAPQDDSRVKNPSLDRELTGAVGALYKTAETHTKNEIGGPIPFIFRSGDTKEFKRKVAELAKDDANLFAMGESFGGSVSIETQKTQRHLRYFFKSIDLK